MFNFLKDKTMSEDIARKNTAKIVKYAKKLNCSIAAGIFIYQVNDNSVTNFYTKEKSSYEMYKLKNSNNRLLEEFIIGLKGISEDK